MGNCLVPQDRVVRVMKPDGKILEYKSPVKADQVLSEFPRHVISDKLPVTRSHLHPTSDMISGHLYYLLPVPNSDDQPKKKKAKKRVRFSEDVKGGGVEAPVVRIKLVITKQELQAMMMRNNDEEGVFTVDETMISKVRKGAEESNN